MALKPDRRELNTTVAYFMNQVSERGVAVSHLTSGSGASMDDGNATVYVAPIASGKEPAGILLNDVVDKDLTHTNINFNKDEMQKGGKVTILKSGKIVTNQVNGEPKGGDVAYLDDNGQMSPAPHYNPNPTVGEFVSIKDEEGFVAISVNVERDFNAGNPFANVEPPLQVEGMYWWGDFSDSGFLFTDVAATTNVTASGDLVAAVKDKSGISNKLFIQSTSGNRPTYTTGVQNGLSGMSTALNKWLTAGDDSDFESSEMSVYLVIKETGVQTSLWNTIFSIQGLVGTPPNGMIFAFENEDSFKVNGLGAVAVSNPIFNLDTPYLISSVVKNGVGVLSHAYGGVGIINPILNTTNPASDIDYTGTRETQISGFQFWDGHIMEIIYYKKYHNSLQRTLIESYLINKWNI